MRRWSPRGLARSPRVAGLLAALMAAVVVIVAAEADAEVDPGLEAGRGGRRPAQSVIRGPEAWGPITASGQVATAAGTVTSHADSTQFGSWYWVELTGQLTDTACDDKRTARLVAANTSRGWGWDDRKDSVRITDGCEQGGDTPVPTRVEGKNAYLCVSAVGGWRRGEGSRRCRYVPARDDAEQAGGVTCRSWWRFDRERLTWRSETDYETAFKVQGRYSRDCDDGSLRLKVEVQRVRCDKTPARVDIDLGGWQYKQVRAGAGCNPASAQFKAPSHTDVSVRLGNPGGTTEDALEKVGP